MERYPRGMILAACNELLPGQYRVFDRFEFNAAFPDNPLTGEPGTSRLLSNLVDSARGAWTAGHDPRTGDVIVVRHAVPRDSNRRVFVDWDRRHLFVTLPDGSLMRADDPE